MLTSSPPKVWGNSTRKNASSSPTLIFAAAMPPPPCPRATPPVTLDCCRTLAEIRDVLFSPCNDQCEAGLDPAARARRLDSGADAEPPGGAQRAVGSHDRRTACRAERDRWECRRARRGDRGQRPGVLRRP